MKYKPLPVENPNSKIENDDSDTRSPCNVDYMIENANSSLSVSEDEKGLLDRDDVKSMGHQHFSHRSPWLRAALLGANDGLVSVASLILGISAAKGSGPEANRMILLSGVAGLVAGSLSMACGEYISVASQRDCEEADIEAERREHEKGPLHRQNELEELVAIYVSRGLNHALARQVDHFPLYVNVQVAEELSKGDVVAVHARDELGINLEELANPTQAALFSCISFAVGAGIPLLSAIFLTDSIVRSIVTVSVCTLTLAAFGAIGSILGGASILKGAFRVVFGGWIAMAVTFGVGLAFGVVNG